MAAPARYTTIDISNLPALTLIDVPDEETILAARMAKLKERWTANDPPNGAVYDVDGLEFDPLKVNQEVNTVFEQNALARVNLWGQQTSLASAWGDNLDAIASTYPVLLDPVTGVASFPRRQPGEQDDRFRYRLWLSSWAFNTAGAEQAYIFWALTSVPTLKDATAIVKRPTLDDDPTVVITLLSARPDSIVTEAEISTARRYLNDPGIKPLTDAVTVQGPRFVDVTLNAGLWLFPGPEASLVLAAVNKAVDDTVEGQRSLGLDFPQIRWEAALAQPGVQNAVTDFITTVTSPEEVVRVVGRNITVEGRAQ
jgi:phage-related baseplate assembly protein